MTSTAPKPARPDHRTPHRTNLEEEARTARLRAANINPRTGLATDYLNHFNEAIMLLEMIPDMPECAEQFLEWRPRSYREHFAASLREGSRMICAVFCAVLEEVDVIRRSVNGWG